jgi:hypothetical protein
MGRSHLSRHKFYIEYYCMDFDYILYSGPLINCEFLKLFEKKIYKLELPIQRILCNMQHSKETGIYALGGM